MKRTGLLLLILSATVLAGRAVSLGQIDDFEDGTTQGWGVGDPAHPLPPINIASSGPGGANDNYLLVRSVGAIGGPGSRLSVFNLAQWGGDYTAEGVGAIAMDVSNFGPDDLFLRLLLADPNGGPPTTIAFSADAIQIPAGGGWTHVVFPVGPADLIAALGTVDDALQNATELRLYHRIDPAPVIPGATPPVTAELGVDNIEALAAAPVPDAGPTGWMLAGPAVLLFFSRRHIRGKV
jgi:hypothetical protein